MFENDRTRYVSRLFFQTLKIKIMETGIYHIEFFDGSKWNLYFGNSTQHKKLLRAIHENIDLIQSYTLTVKGIHEANKIDGIFDIIKTRSHETTI